MSRGPRVSPEEAATILALLREGHSHAEVAEASGRSLGTIYNLRNRERYSVRPKVQPKRRGGARRRIDAEERSRILALAAEGRTDREIGELVGRSVYAVLKIRHRAGLRKLHLQRARPLPSIKTTIDSILDLAGFTGALLPDYTMTLRPDPVGEPHARSQFRRAHKAPFNWEPNPKLLAEVREVYMAPVAPWTMFARSLTLTDAMIYGLVSYPDMLAYRARLEVGAPWYASAVVPMQRFAPPALNDPMWRGKKKRPAIAFLDRMELRRKYEERVRLYLGPLYPEATQ